VKGAEKGEEMVKYTSFLEGYGVDGVSPWGKTINKQQGGKGGRD